MPKLFCEFPKDFIWGAATAAYQVEGAAAEDGRTPSVWDTLSHKHGAIRSDHNGDVACDQYHRFAEDVKLMKDLGVKAYRFSTSWSRIVPEHDKVNQAGLDYYKRLIEELHKNDIQPWMTLFHWDLPQWCEDLYKGWESKNCSEDFGDFAKIIAKNFGDTVAGYMTINEFTCFTDLAYRGGEFPFAPAKKVSAKVLAQVKHHALLGHGMAAQALRAELGSKCPPVGLAENIPNVAPLLETPDDVEAARKALRELTGMFLTPIMEGKYPETYLKDQAANAPTFTDDEMKIISTPLDFVGLNLYTPTYVIADKSSPRGWKHINCEENSPVMFIPWLKVGPSINYWGPRLVHDLWKPKAIYITENGCANDDKLDNDGEVWDTARMMFLQNHLIHAQRATADGVPLKGYFLWSLLDNFEWAWGYTRRFGIHYVNYETQKRTPKLSAKFYKGVIERNAVGGV